jgi:hypothetical protein
MRVPRTLQTYKEPRRLAAAVPWLVLAIFTVITGKLWGVAALVGSLVLGLLILLWAECIALEDREEELIEEAEASEHEIAELEQEVQDAEGQALQLEIRNERLESERSAPALTVPHLLHAIDLQIDTVNRARKHRALVTALGAGEWPVTAIQLTDHTVTVTAHIGDAVQQVSGEMMVLVQKNTGLVMAFAVVVPLGHQTVLFSVELDNVWEEAYEDFAARKVSPDGFVVRLVGLQFEPYRSLTDPQLEALGNALRSAAQAIAGSIGQQAQLTAGEQEGSP